MHLYIYTHTHTLYSQTIRVCVHVCIDSNRLKSTKTKMVRLYIYILYICVYLLVTDSLRSYGLWPAGIQCPWDPPGRNTGVGCHFLLQLYI